MYNTINAINPRSLLAALHPFFKGYFQYGFPCIKSLSNHLILGEGKGCSKRSAEKTV